MRATDIEHGGTIESEVEYAIDTKRFDVAVILRFLSTGAADAHALYRGLGFAPSNRPERAMEIVDPDPCGASTPS